MPADQPDWNRWLELRSPVRHMLLAIVLSVPIALAIHEAIAYLRGQSAVALVEGRWVTLLVTVLVAGPVSFGVALVLQRFEGRVERLNEELRRANAEKDELMAIVSHDLKSPLAALINAAELLQPQLDEPKAKYLGRVIDAKAQQIFELVAGILELGRLDAGFLSQAQQPVSLRWAAESAQTSLAYHAEIKCLSIEHRELAGELWVNTNEQALRLVIDNLLNNAIKFSPIAGKITLESKMGEPGEVLFACHDQGPGLEPELAGRIFGKYEQGERPAREGSRLAGGLGLHIAKRLTEGLGGRIWVESLPGAGASFYVALPSLTVDRSA